MDDGSRQRRQPSRAAFLTQAGALLRKNVRYQRQNWCAAERGCSARGHALFGRDRR
jgi:hypothetical protein